VLTEIVEQGTDVGLGPGENREPVGAAGSGEHQRTAREVEHGQPELAAFRALAELAGVLTERRGKGGDRLGLETGAGVLDGL
jgi:hypothetical protein